MYRRQGTNSLTLSITILNYYELLLSLVRYSFKSPSIKHHYYHPHCQGYMRTACIVSWARTVVRHTSLPSAVACHCHPPYYYYYYSVAISHTQGCCCCCGQAEGYVQLAASVLGVPHATPKLIFIFFLYISSVTYLL